MNYYVKIALVVCACASLASAQYGGYGLDYSDSFLATSFGAQGLNSISAAGARDPRANTGPVVFPPSPPGDPSQTSGVVVGASGYGFVPPGSQVSYKPRPVAWPVITSQLQNPYYYSPFINQIVHNYLDKRSASWGNQF